MASRPRKPNESFEAYRENLRSEERAMRAYLRGRPVEPKQAGKKK